MDKRERQLQLLIPKFGEEVAYMQVYGQSKAEVEAARRSGALPPPSGVTMQYDGRAHAAQDLSKDTDQPPEYFYNDIPEYSGSGLHPYVNINATKRSIRDKIAAQGMYWVEDQQNARLAEDGATGFLATYGGRAAGVLWPAISIFEFGAELMRGGSFARAWGRLNPTWIDPDYGYETTGMAEWWESIVATSGDIIKNIKDPNTYRLALGAGGTAMPTPNLLAFFRARPESVNEARKRSEMYVDNALTGLDVIKAWRAGKGMLGGLSFHKSEGDTDWSDTIINGLIPVGGRLSDNPEEFQKQIAEIDKHTEDYYNRLLTDYGPIWAAAAKTTDEVLGLTIDIFVDPVPLASSIPPGAWNALRKWAPSASSSRVLGAIARRTGRTEDIVDYLTSAEKAFNDAKDAVAKNPTTRNVQKANQMESQLHQARAMVEAADGNHAHERIIIQAVNDSDAPAAKNAKRVLDQKDPNTAELEVIDRNEAYADLIDTSFMDDASPTGPVPADKRKAAVLTGIRRNITAASRSGAPEEVTRSWERTYSLIKDMDADKVPDVISRFTADNVPADWDHLTRSTMIDEEGQTIFHLGEWDEVSEANRVAYTVTDDEWNAQAAQDIINGRNVDDVILPDQTVLKFHTAYTMRPNGVLPDGTIDVEALNSTYRRIAKDAEKARKARINELKNKTKGYALDSKGKLVGDVPRTRRGQPKPGAYDRRKIDSAVDSEFERRSANFNPRKYRKSIEKQVRADLAELRALEGMDEATPFKMDWDAAGGNPLKTNVEAAAWNKTLRDTLSDVWTRGLYPESWGWTTPSLAARTLFLGREPGRALGATYPKMWSRIRNAMRAKDMEYARATASFKGVLLESGAYKRLKDGSIKMTDRTLNDAMYDVLNTPPTDPMYVARMDALPEQARNAVRRFRENMDYYAKKQGIYDTDMYIEGYISWMRDPHNNAGFIKEVKENPSFYVHARHLLERSGTGNPEYVKDLGLIADVYSAAMSRKMHYEPLFIDMDSMARHFGKLNPNHKAWLMGETKRIHSLLSGKPSRANNALRSIGQGVTDVLRSTGERWGIDWLKNATYNPNLPGQAVMGITSLAYMGRLSGTIHYFPMALSTSLATTSGRAGLLSTIHGAAAFATPEGQALAHANGIGQQYRKIMEEGPLRKLTDAMSDFTMGKTSISINQTEAYIRGMGFEAAVHRISRKMGYRNIGEAIRAGKGRGIVAEAARITEEINHMFGVLGKPTIFSTSSRSLGVFATQFLSFIPKQTEELLSMTLKNPGYFQRYMMISGWIQRVAAMEMGVQMGQYVGLGYLPERQDEVRSMGVDMALDLLSFSSEWLDGVTGRGDPVRFGESIDKLTQSAESFIPFGRAVGQRIHLATALYSSLFEGGTPEEYTMLYELNKKYDRNGDFVRMYNFEWPKPEDVFGAMSSDMGGALMGMRSMNDELTSERRKHRRNLMSSRMVSTVTAASAVRDAYHSGDVEKLNGAIERMVELGHKIDMADMFKAVQQAAMIEEHYRMVMSLPVDSRGSMLDIMGDEFGSDDGLLENLENLE